MYYITVPFLLRDIVQHVFVSSEFWPRHGEAGALGCSVFLCLLMRSSGRFGIRSTRPLVEPQLMAIQFCDISEAGFANVHLLRLHKRCG